jgi:HSP20 family protein
MVRIRRSRPREIADLHRRVEGILNTLLHDLPAVTPAASAWIPRADVHETGAALIVTLEIPGVEREDIDIVVEGPYLSITGRRPEPSPGSCVRWHQMEIAHGRFERVIALPEEADPERITATYREGFLEITIPRGDPGPRTVPIGGDRP